MALDIEKNDDGFPLPLSLSLSNSHTHIHTQTHAHVLSLKPTHNQTHAHALSLLSSLKELSNSSEIFCPIFCGRFYSCAPAEDLSIFLPLSEKLLKSFQKYFGAFLRERKLTKNIETWLSCSSSLPLASTRWV